MTMIVSVCVKSVLKKNQMALQVTMNRCELGISCGRQREQADKQASNKQTSRSLVRCSIRSPCLADSWLASQPEHSTAEHSRAEQQRRLLLGGDSVLRGLGLVSRQLQAPAQLASAGGSAKLGNSVTG